MNWNQITLAPVFPLWVTLALFFLGLLFVVLQYGMIRKRLGQSKAVLISFLRLVTLSLLISFSLNPSLTVRIEERVSPTLTILLDTSQSMRLPGQGGKTTRLDDAKAFLLEEDKSLLKSLEKIGNKSSLVLLLSDGNIPWNRNDKKGPPFITFPMGDPKNYRDILIREVRAPSMAFRGRPVQIDVVIKSHGYPGITLPVVLKDGEKVLGAKSIPLRKSSEEMVTSFSFTPEEVGSTSLSLSIPPQFGEALTSNNQAYLTLKVYRDKIRILMVSGSPSLNYRYMRTAFKNDHTIDLLSFVILRTPANIINVPLHEQSLIPFPVESIFTKELKNFDLVIFDNFFYRPYLNLNHLESIKEFVRGGGSFAVIGGPNFFGAGGYIETPIEELLPVRFSGKEDYRRDSVVGINLSRVGATHPITRFSSVGDNLQNLWKEMPPLDGINLLEPKSSGVVLLEGADGASNPILIVGSYGKGRVLILGTDFSWKWYMGMLAQGKGNWAYLRFMERMVRWLTKDPSLDPVQIALPEAKGEIGQEIGIEIQVKDEDSLTKSKGIISFSVFNSDGIKMVSQLKGGGTQGQYLGSFVPEKGGIHKIRVETLEGHLEESFVVREGMENLDGAPDHENLKEIAAATGGKILSNKEDLLKEAQTHAERGQKHFVEERRLPLWGSPYLLVLILGFLGAEWYLRRKGGMI
jgi:uncharacterized membrane protein